MKKFLVTVDGEQFEVTVEELAVDDARIRETTPPPPQRGGVQPRPPVDTRAAAPAPVVRGVEAPAAPAGGETVTAPLPGVVLDVKVQPGDQVAQGTVVVVLEAMKMENEILAPRAGTVAQVLVQKGQSVATGEPLVTIS